MPASPLSQIKPKFIEGPGLGIVRSVPARDVPDRAWVNARNVRFDDRGRRARKIDGFTRYDTTPANEPVRLLWEYVTPTGETILVRVGTTKAWRDAGVSRAEIASGLHGDAGAVVTAAQHADQLLWTDQIDPIKRWTPSTGTTDLPGALVRAAIVLSHKAHLVLFDLVDTGVRQPFRAAYSAPWDPAAGDPDFSAPQAGDLDFLETKGGILAAAVAGESIIVHKRRSMARMIFVGDPDNYTQEPIPSDDGACSRRSPVPVGAFQFYMGHENFYRLGAFPEPIGDAIWPEVFQVLDQAQRHRVFGYHRPEFREIHWKFPTVGATQPSMTAIYNYRDETWALSDHDPALCHVEYPSLIADTWADGESNPWDASQDIPWDYAQYSQSAPLALFGQQDGSLQQYGGKNANGVPIAWFLESKVFQAGPGFETARFLNVVLRAKGQGTLRVRTRAWMDERQDPLPAYPTPGATFPLAGTTKPWVDVRHFGRLFQARLEGDGLDEDFELIGWGPAGITSPSWR